MKFSEMSAWDAQVASNPDGGNVFQSAEFAEVKRLGGWTPLYKVVSGIAVVILQKTVPHLGNFWYIPKGPGVFTPEQVSAVITELRAMAIQADVFVIKIEPELPRTAEVSKFIEERALVATNPIQPNSSTVLIDLRPSLQDILAGFNQKGRHAINRAQRDGVIAKPVLFTPDNAKIMYDLLVQTAAGRFERSIRPYDYYYRFWESFYDTERGSLFFAYSNNQVVSAAFAMYLGCKSTYKDGASVREKTVYGASHLLQWEIMQWMKERGVTQHDLCGAPPSDQVNNTAHPHYGIGVFKTSFNKQITDYIGAYDIVIKPFAYKLWAKVGERLTLRHYYDKHNESWY